jgi:hypothetical protein
VISGAGESPVFSIFSISLKVREHRRFVGVYVQQHGKTMMRPFFLLLFLCSIVFVSCASNPGDADVDSYSGDNGVILNGSGYENLKIDFNGQGDAQFVTASGLQMTRITSSGFVNGESATFILAFPSNTTGTYTWKALSASSGEQDSYMEVRIGSGSETIFYSRGGSTEVTEYGAIGFDVVGTFIGTLRTLDGAKSLSVDGKFTARHL